MPPVLGRTEPDWFWIVAGLSAVLGYKFNDRWEAYLYGQKSLMRPKVPLPYYNMMDLGDRLGAALKYNFSPSFYIELSVEGRKQK